MIASWTVAHVNAGKDALCLHLHKPYRAARAKVDAAPKRVQKGNEQEITHLDIDWEGLALLAQR
jgi:hypothetical protein